MDGFFENEYKTKIKQSLFYKVQKYNEVERLNKNQSLFISGLVKLLKDKNCTYEYDDSKSIVKTESVSKIIKKQLLDTKDITNKQYQELLELQTNGCATQQDKLKIEKHIYKLK